MQASVRKYNGAKHYQRNRRGWFNCSSLCCTRGTCKDYQAFDAKRRLCNKVSYVTIIPFMPTKLFYLCNKKGSVRPLAELSFPSSRIMNSVQNDFGTRRYAVAYRCSVMTNALHCKSLHFPKCMKNIDKMMISAWGLERKQAILKKRINNMLQAKIQRFWKVCMAIITMQLSACKLCFISVRTWYIVNRLLCENRKSIPKFLKGKKLLKNVTLQILNYIPVS